MQVLGKRKSLQNSYSYKDYASEGTRQKPVNFEYMPSKKKYKRMNSEKLKKNTRKKRGKGKNQKKRKIFRYNRPKKNLDLDKLGQRLVKFSKISNLSRDSEISDKDEREDSWSPERDMAKMKKVKKNMISNITELKLSDKQGGSKMMYPVIKDSDMKMPDDIQNMLNKMAMDDDNRTTESILDRAMRKTYTNLTKAVEGVSLRRRRPYSRRADSSGNLGIPRKRLARGRGNKRAGSFVNNLSSQLNKKRLLESSSSEGSEEFL
jgi:hypothetical protein